MSRGSRVVLIAFVVMMVLFVGSGVLLAAAVAHAGIVGVKIHSAGPDGTVDLDLPVPAALISLGLLGVRLGPRMHWENDGVTCDFEEWAPAAAAMLEELAGAPDMVLVDVRDRGEWVRIAKRGGTLEVHVEGHDGEVEVTLPAKLLPQIAAALD